MHCCSAACQPAKERRALVHSSFSEIWVNGVSEIEILDDDEKGTKKIIWHKIMSAKKA